MTVSAIIIGQVIILTVVVVRLIIRANRFEKRIEMLEGNRK